MELINGLKFASQGKYLLSIIGTGIVTMCLAGCSEENFVANESQIEQNLATKLKEISDVLADGKVDSFVYHVVSNISLFSSTEKQIEWYRKALDEVFSADISHSSYKRQYRSYCVIGDMWSGISAGLSGVSKKTWLERWRLRLNDLVWKQHQLERLKGEFSLSASSVKPIPISALKRERGLKSAIECMQTDLQGEIDRYERWYLEEKDQMSHEEHLKIGEMFSGILGRPLRSLEQIETDCQKRLAAYRRAEEAAMFKTNRPPSRILIDGTNESEKCRVENVE